MKKICKAIKIAFKQFFESLKEDIKDLFKKHWLKLIGYIISILVPSITLIVVYCMAKPTSWAVPVFVWLPVIVFVWLYWSKIRTYLAIKVERMTCENSMEKGKHAGAIITIKTLQVIMTIIPFLVLYYVFKSLAEANLKVENLFLLLTICEAVGGLFIIFDTVKNVVDYTELENPPEENKSEEENK